MRMWNVNPKLLCRQHLLGEHLEMHMFASSMQKNVSMQGFLDNGLLEPDKVEERHADLAAEMTERGYNHKSPLSFSPPEHLTGKGEVNIEANLIELSRRCLSCSTRIYNA